mgnify:CR=1 FL=1
MTTPIDHPRVSGACSCLGEYLIVISQMYWPVTYQPSVSVSSLSNSGHSVDHAPNHNVCTIVFFISLYSIK